MNTSFYTEKELSEVGFKAIGKNVLISKKASFYGTSNIEIGNNVRIDDFCILSGNIKLGNNIHISAYVALYGANGIELHDYSGISPKATIYSAMDDFNGDFLVGPIHPTECTNVKGGKVVVESFVQIGCNSIIFPDVTLYEGCVVGAGSLVKKSLESWGIYAGIPTKFIKARNKGMVSLTY